MGNIREYRVECRRDDPSTIECWEWENIDDSEIDREEGDHHEDRREWDAILNYRDKSRPETDRPCEHILRLCVLNFCFWSKES